MTAAQPNDPTTMVGDMLSSVSLDLFRPVLTTFIQTLMGAEADALCGASYGECSPDRVNSGNGYRRRDFDTRVVTLDVAVPKLPSGSYFPDWLLEGRTAPNPVWCRWSRPCTWWGSRPGGWRSYWSLRVTALSKSQVSVMARDLDERVQAFRTRPLDQGPYTFLGADAVLKVCEGGRVVQVHALLATGVNGDGHREILGWT